MGMAFPIVSECAQLPIGIAVLCPLVRIAFRELAIRRFSVSTQKYLCGNRGGHVEIKEYSERRPDSLLGHAAQQADCTIRRQAADPCEAKAIGSVSNARSSTVPKGVDKFVITSSPGSVRDIKRARYEQHEISFVTLLEPFSGYFSTPQPIQHR